MWCVNRVKPSDETHRLYNVGVVVMDLFHPDLPLTSLALEALAGPWIGMVVMVGEDLMSLLLWKQICCKRTRIERG